MIVMRKDGSISAMQPTDLKEVAKRDERISQLEKLNATLAAEIDRMRPVVDAAIEWKTYGLAESDDDELLEAIADYEASQPK